ncbi:high nitrogen upregulated cytochrome P450 monooxygenase 2 [Auriculariales sp. MPI-PUGE-AT-0066]|nr:high nitrogen upregulated cytochrome P450 monooxygenase 2 [Auriculariales sp. MPI-PUGE-AT-0066]
MSDSQSVVAFAALGLVLHQVYRRYEPTWQYFALSFPAVFYGYRRLPPLAAATAELTALPAAAITIASIFASMLAYPSYLSGNDYKKRKALHDKYGPVVRVAPNEVSINELQAISVVLGAKSFPKDKYYRARMAPGDAKAVITLSGLQHTHRRRLWNRAFGTEQVSVYTEQAKVGVQRLLRQMDAAIERGETVDLTRWFRYYGFDFMGQIAFGKDFDLVESGSDPRGLVEIVTTFAAAIGWNANLWWIGRQAWIAPWLMPKLFRMRKLAQGFCFERVQRTSTTIDLWHYLGHEDEKLQSDLKLQPLNFPNLAQEAVLTVIAGSDTSTTAMCSMMFFLLAHPHCYERALAELDSVAEHGHEPWFSSEAHTQLPYLNACLDEALRLLPVVPVNGPRAVPVGSGGIRIGEHFFPEGTEIYVSPYVFHSDERYFSPRTSEYCPERWIEPGWNTTREAFIPFSAGPTQCVGKHIARIEILMVLTALMRHYKISFPENYKPETFLGHVRENFVMEVPSLPVILVKRNKA